MACVPKKEEGLGIKELEIEIRKRISAFFGRFAWHSLDYLMIVFGCPSEDGQDQTT